MIDLVYNPDRNLDLIIESFDKSNVVNAFTHGNMGTNI